MAYISKIGIANDQIADADHILRIIRALNGEDEKDIKILGKLELVEGKIYISDILLEVTAGELNGLHDRTPGITEAEKPIIPDADKELDYLRILSLSVGQLILDQPDVGGIAGRVYAHDNFV
ncbi:MAG: hypothetical protein A2V66_16300 [Ignavibacteria bacterium RBG_13_36_8]|nr:MAG: hypothetical protein A2V66_16300 [Ignavibacteria bacterium RBG_13_36_8]